MRIENPYHEGELYVQGRLGELEEGRRNGRAISNGILKGAVKFVEQQSMIVLGSVDFEGNVWSSILFGAPGFLRVPDEESLELDLSQAALHPNDPFFTNIERDPRVGLLIIELATRRRLRVNGHITRSDNHLRVTVDESYPNCPKYIQRRHLTRQLQTGTQVARVVRGKDVLNRDHQRLVLSADTFFVASANPAGGVDVSHRGGMPGFVRMLDNGTLRIPDYSGNRMYNTLGNLALNPRAGLVFLDFEQSRVLMLSGDARILWNEEDPNNETGGTGRFWEFEPRCSLELPLPVELEWEFLDHSPHNPK